MDGLECRGWKKITSHKYHHYCGASITKQGKLWTSSTTTDSLMARHNTAREAMAFIEQTDPTFWTCGHLDAIAPYGDMYLFEGFLDENQKDRVFVCNLSEGKDFPEFLKPVFSKHFFGRVTCVKCMHPMTEFRFCVLWDLLGSKEKTKRKSYISCECGHPVWRVDYDLAYAAERDLRNATQILERRQKASERRMRLKEAGGTHSINEIAEILAFQSNRCIYCHVQFTSLIRPTKDHLLPISLGGSDWSLNIVLACRTCNSRRGNIPFSNYCKILNRTQNKRILRYLHRRLVALDIDAINQEAFNTVQDFVKILSHHYKKCKIEDE